VLHVVRLLRAELAAFGFASAAWMQWHIVTLNLLCHLTTLIAWMLSSAG
jgi:hypothetical protein